MGCSVDNLLLSRAINSDSCVSASTWKLDLDCSLIRYRKSGDKASGMFAQINSHLISLSTGAGNITQVQTQSNFANLARTNFLLQTVGQAGQIDEKKVVRVNRG
jgi:hypothetical protein